MLFRRYHWLSSTQVLVSITASSAGRRPGFLARRGWSWTQELQHCENTPLPTRSSFLATQLLRIIEAFGGGDCGNCCGWCNMVQEARVRQGFFFLSCSLLLHCLMRRQPGPRVHLKLFKYPSSTWVSVVIDFLPRLRSHSTKWPPRITRRSPRRRT